MLALRQSLINLTIVMVTASISGCISPRSVTNPEELTTVKTNLSHAQKTEVRVSATITLPEAIARALKYNLDKRLHTYRTALASGQAALATWQILPSPEFNYTNDFRSNHYVALDREYVPSTSSFTPKDIQMKRYQVSWNMLDFALGYIRARQKFDEIHITEEQERKTIQQIVAQVMLSYWQGYQTQQLSPKLTALREQVETAIWRSNKIREAKATTDITQLEYQQLLIRHLRHMTALYLQLSKGGKPQLASLISAPPNSQFKLAPPPANFTNIKALHLSRQQLSTLALVYRPELRELTYRRRIADSGVSEAILNILPSADVIGGKERTSNDFVKEKRWYNVNFNMTWYLLKLVSLPNAIKAAHAQIGVENLTQAALSLAVIMQVSLAYNEYHLLQMDYHDSTEEVKTEHEIFDKTKLLLQAYRSNEQALIWRKLNYYNSVIDNDVSLAAAYSALNKLKLAVGMSPLPHIDSQMVNRMSLQSLTLAVNRELSISADKSFSNQVQDGYATLMSQIAELKRWKQELKMMRLSGRRPARVPR